MERCKYRVTVPFCRLLVVFGQGKQKSQHLFNGYAGKITFAKLDCKTREDKRTGLDGIFLELARWYCRWKSTAWDTFMVHLLSLGLLVENAMYEVYTMGGVIGRRCCLTQE
jgi:hypothetical protein